MPNADRAIVLREKLTDYLLSASHPTGRYKAAFFRSLGYERSSWEKLEFDLRELLAGDATPAGRTVFGEKFEIRGEITGPNGRVAALVTVWIILAQDPVPRFVTAYPED
jgi:hypothetical protein